MEKMNPALHDIIGKGVLSMNEGDVFAWQFKVEQIFQVIQLLVC